MELAAGCVDASREAELRGHLAKCEMCRAAHAECKAVWRAMGAWGVETPAVETDDLAQRVMDAAAQERMGRMSRAHGRVWRMGPVLRIAAMVVVSVSAGMLAGVWSMPGVTMIGGRQVAEKTLLLREFQNGSPAKFAQAIAGFDAARMRQDAKTMEKRTEKQTEKKP